jgi:hypothetical protein
MTFDDQLKDAFETLTSRLRGEIDRQLQAVVADLSAAALADRERLESELRSAAGDIEIAAAAARQQAHADGRGLGKEEGHREGVAAGRQQAEQESIAVRDAAVGAAIAAAHATEEKAVAGAHAAGKETGRREGAADARQVDAQDRATRDAAVSAAVADAHAAGKEVGRLEGVAEGRQQAEQDRRTALDATVAAADVAPRDAVPAVAIGASDRLAAAVRSIDAGRSLSEILDALVTTTGEQAARAGVWLVRGGRFSSWRVTGFGPDLDTDLGNRSLDLSHDDAGMIADAARTNGVVSRGAGEPGPPTPVLMTTAGAGVAVPIAMSGQVVAVLYADEGSSSPPARLLSSAAVEVLARHAARCLEALTAFKAARALTERPGPVETTETPSADAASVEDDASARRFARLLVSEIKLYHESAVIDGRRDRDLATRLGGEIARARVLYEQRVPPEVRQRTDFFRQELVRTLADGDPALLDQNAATA